MRSFFYSLMILLAAFSSFQTQADIVTYTFIGATGLDDNTGGGTVTQLSSVSSTPLTLTVVSASAPDFSGGQPLPGGPNVGAQSNIGNQGSNGILAVNNTTINNNNFTALTGLVQNETINFNNGEEVTISFDLDVIFNSIDYASLGGGEIAEITVNGATTFFGNTNPGDVFNDPLNGLLIPAGTPVVFGAFNGAVQNSFNIDTLSFELVAVPEPSSALLGVFAVAGILVRRRRTSN